MSTRAFWVILVLVGYAWIGLTTSELEVTDSSAPAEVTECDYRRKCVGNTASKVDDLEPDAFWPISTAYHATDIVQTNNNPVLAAIGASISPTPGLSSHDDRAVTRESMLFTGGLGSYAEIANTDGSLNGDHMFTWAISILPDSIELTSADGYIMAYYGSNGQDGLQVLQRGPDLVLQIFDLDGNSIGENVHTNAFASLKWISLLISFNGLSSPARIETNVIVPEDSRPSEDYQGMDLGEIHLVSARGNIRFGRSFDDSKPSFTGRISCILKFPVFVFGRAAKEVHTLCDPNMYNNPAVSINWSMDDPPQPSPEPELPPTTKSEPEPPPLPTTTTEPVAPPPSTSAELKPPPPTTASELEPQTTTPEPELPTTNHVTAARDQSSGERGLTTARSTETQTDGYPDDIPLDTCVRHHLYLEGFVLTSVMLNQPVNAVQDCSRLCRWTSNCVSFSVTGQSTDTQLTCSLGSERRPQDLTPYTGARIFTLV